jgi:hypothetical protein
MITPFHNPIPRLRAELEAKAAEKAEAEEEIKALKARVEEVERERLALKDQIKTANDKPPEPAAPPAIANSAEPIVVAEKSNPGPVGQDTGYSFEDPKTGQTIEVIAEVGENHDEAIKRVREAHGLPA